MKGPKGHITYVGDGNFQIKKMKPKRVETIKATNIGLIAGGTGLTPILQVVTAILKERDNDVRLSLIFANQTEEDIFLRDMLESLAANSNGRFKIWYTLDRPPKRGWKYSEGFINADMIEAHLPEPSPTTLVLCCGPPPMIKYACLPAFEKLGYTEDMYESF
jgi:cytochrome-b5 reductase